MKASAISVSQLRAELGGDNPPIVIDVRRQAAFVGASEMIAGALRRDPEQAAAWAKSLPRASSVVVYCAHGREVSQGVATALAENSIASRYLEGGVEAWKAGDGKVDHT